jgi:hypothetical protein
MSKFRFSKISNNIEIAKIQREIEDNFVAIDKNGNVVLKGNITAKDAYLDGDSLYLGKVKFTAPKPDESGLVWKYDNTGNKAVWTDDISAVDAAPILHGSDHENGGDDEINLDGLSGIPADMQAMNIAISVALGMP